MKISLHLNGRTMSFSQEELLSKLERLEELEKRFSDSTTEETDVEIIYEQAEKPTECKFFKVIPASIDENVFMKKKLDFMQEWTRKSILKAIAEVKQNPIKYSKPFATFIPKKTWKCRTVNELKAIANNKNTHIANWVEQSLEWAQRIINGESWINVCNIPDFSNWYRLVVWKDNNARIVGGSNMCGDSLPPCTVFGNHCNPNDVLHFTVPLIVFYP